MATTNRGNNNPQTYLSTLAALYEAAYYVANQLADGFAVSERRDALLQQLREKLVAITAWEDQNVEARNALLTSSKSDEASREVSRVQSLIAKVLQAVHSAEQAAAAARSQLAPQLDQRTKARQVKAAYGAAIRDAGG